MSERTRARGTSPDRGDTQPTDRADRIAGAIIVGGGYAGLHAARVIERTGVRAIVIDPSADHGFITRLAAVAGHAAPASSASAPMAALASDLIAARVTQVADGSVTLDDGRMLTADAVVLTAGSRPSSPAIPGLDRALTLRTAADGLRMRSAIAAAPAVVIMGGGATGVQLAGAVAAARRRLTDVHVVDSEVRLLPSYGRPAGRRAEQILSKRGVRLHLGCAVESVENDAVILADGRRLAGLPVWAGGFTADAAALGAFAVDGGRIAVEGDLRVRGMTRTFAAGDIAAHADPTGRPLPMSAQIAVQAGAGAGRNAAAIVRGERTRSVRLRQRGWVLDLSGGRGVAELGPLTLGGLLSAPVPPLLHALIDVKNLVEIAGLPGLRFLPPNPFASLEVDETRVPMLWPLPSAS